MPARASAAKPQAIPTKRMTSFLRFFAAANPPLAWRGSPLAQLLSICCLFGRCLGWFWCCPCRAGGLR